MQGQEATSHRISAPAEERYRRTVPQLSLPKGGGAIRGMGGKFAANAVTGTASLTVPVATSSGRAGFGPQLSFSYDSGAGNGPFGLGWNLSLPSITRKTDKRLPQYGSGPAPDVFILSGAEDLVPSLVAAGDEWVPEPVGNVVVYEYVSEDFANVDFPSVRAQS